jgi:hypothetical protein
MTHDPKVREALAFFDSWMMNDEFREEWAEHAPIIRSALVAKGEGAVAWRVVDCDGECCGGPFNERKEAVAAYNELRAKGAGDPYRVEALAVAHPAPVAPGGSVDTAKAVPPASEQSGPVFLEHHGRRFRISRMEDFLVVDECDGDQLRSIQLVRVVPSPEPAGDAGDVASLVTTLRCWGPEHFPHMHAAADLIERLAAERDRLQRQLNDSRTELREETERMGVKLKCERDAAGKYLSQRDSAERSLAEARKALQRCRTVNDSL